MERQIAWTNNGIGIIKAEERQGQAPSFLAEEVVEKITAFHSTVPGYAVTPLAELSARAKELGLGNIFVKDESHRFGLNAFKGLGGIYAVSKVICEKLGLDKNSVVLLISTEGNTDPDHYAQVLEKETL